MKIEMEMLDEHVIFAGGDVTESYLCVDCGVNTAPGCSTKAEVMAKLYRPGRRSKVVGHMRASSKSELYIVRNAVWKKAGMKPWGGCLCVGCLEKRIGRKLKPKDFLKEHPFNDPRLPCTERLRKRRQ